MKFDFSKSIDTDFRNKLQSDLNNLNKNIIYVTYQVDKCVKLLKELLTDKNLQKQVDQYFEEDSENIPEEK